MVYKCLWVALLQSDQLVLNDWWCSIVTVYETGEGEGVTRQANVTITLAVNIEVSVYRGWRAPIQCDLPAVSDALGQYVTQSKGNGKCTTMT